MHSAIAIIPPFSSVGVQGFALPAPLQNLFWNLGCVRNPHAEPSTGITLRAAKRLMLSSWFGSKWRSIEPAARDTFLPIFWAEEASEVSCLSARYCVLGFHLYGSCSDACNCELADLQRGLL